MWSAHAQVVAKIWANRPTVLQKSRIVRKWDSRTFKAKPCVDVLTPLSWGRILFGRPGLFALWCGLLLLRAYGLAGDVQRVQPGRGLLRKRPHRTPAWLLEKWNSQRKLPGLFQSWSMLGRKRRNWIVRGLRDWLWRHSLRWLQTATL